MCFNLKTKKFLNFVILYASGVGWCSGNTGYNILIPISWNLEAKKIPNLIFGGKNVKWPWLDGFLVDHRPPPQRGQQAMLIVDINTVWFAWLVIYPTIIHRANILQKNASLSPMTTFSTYIESCARSFFLVPNNFIIHPVYWTIKWLLQCIVYHRLQNILVISVMWDYAVPQKLLVHVTREYILITVPRSVSYTIRDKYYQV